MLVYCNCTEDQDKKQATFVETIGVLVLPDARKKHGRDGRALRPFLWPFLYIFGSWQPLLVGYLAKV